MPVSIFLPPCNGPSHNLIDRGTVYPTSYGATNLADQTRLSDINKNDLAEFATLLEEKQAPLLKKLSNLIAPTLSALAAFYQGHDMNLAFSLVDIESLKDIPKALLTLSADAPHGI